MFLNNAKLFTEKQTSSDTYAAEKISTGRLALQRSLGSTLHEPGPVFLNDAKQFTDEQTD